MKNLNIIICFFVMTLITFTSCSKSDDGNTVIPGNQSYWPLKQGNQWSFNDPENEENMDYKIYHTVNYQGKDYHSYIDQNNEISYPLAVREDEGIFKMYYGAHIQQETTIGEGNITYLNVNLPVGQTWTDEMKLDFSSGTSSGQMIFNHSGKVLAKSASEVVNGKTYKDILKIELIQKVTNTLTGVITNTKSTIWLSKGVGPIREIIEIDDFKNDYLLKEYTLK